MTPHSSGSVSGLNAGTVPAFSNSAPLCTTSVASPPSSTMSVGPVPSGHSSASLVHHQYSSSVSPFQANTGVPFGVCGRAAGFRPADDDRGGGVILGREDVARDPAHVGAELGQRLDEHRRLNRHVQAAHDARAGERLLAARAAAGAPSGRASPARRDGFPCGRTRRATDPSPCTARGRRLRAAANGCSFSVTVAIDALFPSTFARGVPRACRRRSCGGHR